MIPGSDRLSRIGPPLQWSRAGSMSGLILDSPNPRMISRRWRHRTQWPCFDDMPQLGRAGGLTQTILITSANRASVTSTNGTGGLGVR